MSKFGKTEYLDIFETQEIVQFIWNHYARNLLSAIDEDIASETEYGRTYEHNDADIQIWSWDWDEKFQSGMKIEGDGFEISARPGDDDHTKALHVNYIGDRQTMAEWLLDWRLLM